MYLWNKTESSLTFASNKKYTQKAFLIIHYKLLIQKKMSQKFYERLGAELQEIDAAGLYLSLIHI